MTATLWNDGESSTNLSIFRAVGGEPFGDEECRLVQALVPHLLRAFQLHNRIQGLERKAAIVEEALDGLQIAVVLLDARGHVLLVNKAAEHLLSSQKYLQITRARLHALRADEDRALQRLIAGAAETGNGKGTHPGGLMALSRKVFSDRYRS